MSDIVNYVSSALARGIHQNAFAASCDGTQMLAGPDRFPRLRKDLKKEPDPTATLPAPEGGELAGPRGAAIVTAPWGGVKCSDMFTAGQGGGAGGPQQGAGAVVDFAGRRGGGELGLGLGYCHGLDRGGSTDQAAN
jgi:hypothetical protein